MPLGRMSLWMDDYLAQKVGRITVATTPDGSVPLFRSSEFHWIQSMQDEPILSLK